MTERFNAVVAEQTDDKPGVGIKELGLDDLPDEDVLVEIAYSSLNFKDGLAVTGKAPICRRLPMVCGIDLAGTVVESSATGFAAGDQVVVNGWGLSEKHWGGYSKYQRLKPEWLVPLPEGLSVQQAMAIGTAGYTAMLCVMALQDGGVEPGGREVVVTGASGGVGSVAVCLLSSLGYQVVASTGSVEHAAYLESLGASRVIPRDELSRPAKPLEKEIWAGAVDSVGSQTLATVLAQTQYGGTVAACGLAGGSDLPTTVMPFILRGVRLIGVDSVMAPKSLRERAWDRLAGDLDLDKLAALTTVEPMSDIKKLAEQIVSGQTRGRIVIDVNG